MRRHLRLFLYLSAFFFITCSLFLSLKRFGFSRFDFKNYQPSTEVVADFALPTRLVIDSLGIDQAIEIAAIKDGQWPLTEKGVTYLAGSGFPGAVGNAVIYGHNWPQILGSLKKIKPGDKITVKFENATQVSYEVEYLAVVTSDQTHILNPTNDKRLTIYTCTGFLDSKRLVVVAINRN